MKVSILKWALAAVVLLGIGACNDGGGDDGPVGGDTPLTVLVVGDSISGDFNYPGVSPWPSLLSSMNPNLTVINAAVGAETSAGGAAKIGSLIRRFNPGAVVIFYGANDVINGLSGSAPGNIESMINAVQGSGARAIVCNVLPMFGTRGAFNGGVIGLNPQIQSVASSTGAKFVNVNGAASDISLYPDGLHPNADGQRILAVEIGERL